MAVLDHDRLPCLQHQLVELDEVFLPATAIQLPGVEPEFSHRLDITSDLRITLGLVPTVVTADAIVTFESKHS